MVPHHQSAIAMAEEATKAGLNEPKLIAVATDIVASQQSEIDQMKQWRKRWYGSATIDPAGASALGMSMDEMGMGHSSGDIAKAANVDAAFASMMSPHHQGAIVMAKLALDKGIHPEIKALARRIIAAQERELKVMKPSPARTARCRGCSEGTSRVTPRLLSTLLSEQIAVVERHA